MGRREHPLWSGEWTTSTPGYITRRHGHGTRMCRLGTGCTICGHSSSTRSTRSSTDLTATSCERRRWNCMSSARRRGTKRVDSGGHRIHPRLLIRIEPLIAQYSSHFCIGIHLWLTDRHNEYNMMYKVLIHTAIEICEKVRRRGWERVVFFLSGDSWASIRQARRDLSGAGAEAVYLPNISRSTMEGVPLHLKSKELESVHVFLSATNEHLDVFYQLCLKTPRDQWGSHISRSTCDEFFQLQESTQSILPRCLSIHSCPPLLPLRQWLCAWGTLSCKLSPLCLHGWQLCKWPSPLPQHPSIHSVLHTQDSWLAHSSKYDHGSAQK